MMNEKMTHSYESANITASVGVPYKTVLFVIVILLCVVACYACHRRIYIVLFVFFFLRTYTYKIVGVPFRLISLCL